jgi:hypothetical protein
MVWIGLLEPRVAHIPLEIPEVVVGIDDGLVVIHVALPPGTFGRGSSNVAIIALLVMGCTIPARGSRRHSAGARQ